MSTPNPCSALHRLPRGASENLSLSQSYRLAHTAECRLLLNAKRPDRNLRFILGHAFTLDKINLRILEIEEDEKAQAVKPVPDPNPSGRVSFQEGASNRRQQMGDAGSPARKRSSPPPPAPAEDDSDTSSDDEDDDGLALTLTTSHGVGDPHSVADLVPSSDSDSSDEDEDEPTSPRFSDTVLETIIEEPSDESLAELYETVAGCPCHGREAPVIEQIWEIPQAVLDEEKKRYEESMESNKGEGEKKRLGRKLGSGRRVAVVRVAA